MLWVWRGCACDVVLLDVEGEKGAVFNRLIAALSIFKFAPYEVRQSLLDAVAQLLVAVVVLDGRKVYLGGPMQLLIEVFKRCVRVG